MAETETDYPVVVLAGPTASGKSRLALRLAQEFSGEILCCDALQIYRGMEIGTAKPTVAERALVPHHLVDLRDPTAEFSAGEYERAGREALESVRRRGRLPLVVGGTGLYLRALERGLFEGPGRSEELRARMRRIAARGGAARLHRALARVDPASGARIAPADLPRIIRAYEVYCQSGTPISRWHARATRPAEGFRWCKLALSIPRPELYARINARVDEMFERGFVDEVRDLLRRFPRDAPAFKAIGYRQVARFLEGALTLPEAMEEVRRQSRRYAKRQLTWFRAEADFIWLAGDEAACLDQARGAIRDFVVGRHAGRKRRL